MGSRIFLSFVLAGLCVCVGAGAAHAALSARPELKARDGASWLVVTVANSVRVGRIDPGDRL